MPFKLNANLILITVLTGLEAVAFLSIHSIQQLQQFDYTATTPLKPNKAVIQTLPIEHDNLTALILYIGPVATQTVSDVRVNLQADHQTIYTTTADSSTFSTNPFLPFDFATQADSNGKTYTLTVSFPDGVQTSTATPEGTPISFFALPQFDVRLWQKLSVLTQRININHGGIVPPFVVYVLLTAALWMSNLYLVRAASQAWNNFRPNTRSS